MAVLTEEQVLGIILAQPGGRNAPVNGLATALAVAKYASGFDPAAHFVGPRDDSWGLWQINMLGRLGPDRRRRYNFTSDQQLTDPALNARIMLDLSGGATDFTRHWAGEMSRVTEQDREHFQRVVLESALTPITNIPGVPFPLPGDALDDVPIVGDVIEAGEAVGVLVSKLLSVDFWRRIGKGAIGVALVLVALVLLGRDLIKDAAAPLTP